MGEGAETDNKVRGSLKRSQWVGSAFRLFVDVNGLEIRADAPRHDCGTIPESGGAVTLHFAADDTTLIPEVHSANGD